MVIVVVVAVMDLGGHGLCTSNSSKGSGLPSLSLSLLDMVVAILFTRTEKVARWSSMFSFMVGKLIIITAAPTLLGQIRAGGTTNGKRGGTYIHQMMSHEMSPCSI